jgi:multimeric flavodoxin WrbA
MRVTILDGSPEGGAGIEQIGPRLSALEARLAERSHSVRRLALNELRIAQCRGCFECWIKAPGKCTTRDEAEHLLAAMMGADLFILASPTIMGFPSALLKRATERLLPLLHPYFHSRNGEVHHRARYARYPRLGLLYGEQGCDEEDAQIMEAIYNRLALNYNTTLAFAASTATTPEELCHAIDGV